MACHICNVFFWGLDLRDPVAVECEVSDRHEETFPAWSRVTWQYPARSDRPALKLHWCDGGQLPAADLFDGHKIEGNGSLLIGEAGKMYIPSADGAHYTLLPESKFADFKRPPKTLPNSPGHHAEWINNIKTGELGLDYMSHFGRAAAMTEALLLGALATRAGRRIEWDARQMKITNIHEANEYVDPPYRKGWES